MQKLFAFSDSSIYIRKIYLSALMKLSWWNKQPDPLIILYKHSVRMNYTE